MTSNFDFINASHYYGQLPFAHGDYGGDGDYVGLFDHWNGQNCFTHGFNLIITSLSPAFHTGISELSRRVWQSIPWGSLIPRGKFDPMGKFDPVGEV